MNATQALQCTQAERAKRLVVQGLQLLFHCEYLVLVEYMECIVPLILLGYKSILEQLPNVVYYPGDAGNWGVNALENVLRAGSWFIIFPKHIPAAPVAFSPLYQLVFVLEMEIYVVQVIFFVEILVVLQYELEHFGEHPFPKAAICN